ncbi:MAG TPA: DNA repair protein RecO [Rhodospirillaceae bacterium]|nr:MAG: DNA repair protein RecO [Alphaproteobacteria bacterium GWF2_58_20]HAU28846.1 DNA repair protein RecO [Rhodospirillaceae bacterium]
MEWRDEALVLAVRPYGDTSVIATLLTQEHGLHAGLVRGGQGRRMQPILQPGMRVAATWRSMQAERLGTFALEALSGYHVAALFGDSVRLAALQSACVLVATALPEREIQPGMFEATLALMEALSGDAWAESYVMWESGLIGLLGYAFEGQGEMPVPGFLCGKGGGGTKEVLDGLRLTGYFLEHHVFAVMHKPVPAARQRFVEAYDAAFGQEG